MDQDQGSKIFASSLSPPLTSNDIKDNIEIIEEGRAPTEGNNVTIKPSLQPLRKGKLWKSFTAADVIASTMLPERGTSLMPIQEGSSQGSLGNASENNDTPEMTKESTLYQDSMADHVTGSKAFNNLPTNEIMMTRGHLAPRQARRKMVDLGHIAHQMALQAKVAHEESEALERKTPRMSTPSAPISNPLLDNPVEHGTSVPKVAEAFVYTNKTTDSAPLKVPPPAIPLSQPSSVDRIPRSSIANRRKSSIAVTNGSSIDPDKNRRISLNTANADITKHRVSVNNTMATGHPTKTAIKQKFTVTEEILKQIKRKNGTSKKIANGWSPKSWKTSSSGSKNNLMDTENLVNSYVELVCDDLRTSEKKRISAESLSRWVIDPGATWRVRWDLFILVLVIWTSYSVPFRTAFGLYGSLSYFDLFIDLAFLFDIVLNFFTAYYEPGGIIQTNITAIIKRYVKTWFVLDLLSAIPTSFHPTSSRVLLAIRFLKLLRLFRLKRYMDSKDIAMYFTPSMLRLINTFLFLTWVWHVITCGYWYISRYQGLGSTLWTPDREAMHNSDLLNYFLCFGWTVQTTFSISPFDPPETLIEAIFTILCFLVGIFMNAYVIGSAGSALQSLDEAKTQRRQLMDRIITYMKKRELPPYFQRIILDFYNYMSDRHSEEDILTDLPPAIQLRLSLLLNRELVKNIPLLKQLELNTIIGLMQTLQSTMYMPGEHIFKIGEKAEHLYFVKTGQLEVTLDSVTVVSTLQKGDMFGQVALTTDGNHDFNVRAAVYSEVLSLTREAYDDLANESEKFMELVEREAIKQEQFIVKAQKNLKRLAKMARFVGANGDEQDDDHGDETDGRRKGMTRSSKHKVRVMANVVNMFKKGSSGKVQPK